jgi:hypothetical protein
MASPDDREDEHDGREPDEADYEPDYRSYGIPPKGYTGVIT